MKASYPAQYQHIRGASIDVSNILVDFMAIPRSEGDSFFEQYGVGNVVGGIDKPYERLSAYESLLEILADHDINQFKAIHKGTAYYFMGWTAFQIEDYEKGVFYMDSGISEDIRKLGLTDPKDFSRRTPGINFMLLETGNQIAAVTAASLITLMEESFLEFSKLSGAQLDRHTFIDKFVIGSGLFLDNTFRTVVTSLYSFVLEFDTRQRELKIRSSEGTSIEPFLTHLFKGCLVFETLLKLLPPGNRASTLRPAIDAHNRNLSIDTSLLPSHMTLEEVANYNIELVKQKKPHQDISFATAYGIRNTAGHKLAWPDVFQQEKDVYPKLYKAVLGACLWTIYKLWVE